MMALEAHENKCLWCKKSPLPADYLELRRKKYRWFFCSFLCLQEQLQHNSQIHTDLDNELDTMKEGAEKGCENFKPQNPLALVSPMTCQYCFHQGACEREASMLKKDKKGALM